MKNTDNRPPEPGGEQRAAGTGNASNPSPTGMESPGSNQLLDKNAEKYLREVASIEDVPDAQDQKDMDETLEKEK